jgi:L-amino acid N-acyltransferase YncA
MQKSITIQIKKFDPQHWQEVAEIYRLGLLSRNATFEIEVPDFESWNKKFHDHLRWVVVLENKIVGWAGLLPVSVRKVYDGVTEVSIYIHPDFAGQGIGKQLMNHLITESEKAGIWTLYASIFPENKASIQLHVSNGFREIGYRERIAQLDGKWRDTVLFERRSKLTGI